jgi:hypothetical protein
VVWVANSFVTHSRPVWALVIGVAGLGLVAGWGLAISVAALASDCIIAGRNSSGRSCSLSFRGGLFVLGSACSPIAVPEDIF